MMLKGGRTQKGDVGDTEEVAVAMKSEITVSDAETTAATEAPRWGTKAAWRDGPGGKDSHDK